MWDSFSPETHGIVGSFGRMIGRACGTDPTVLPDLSESDTLFVTSDYSGQHKGSRYEAFALLVVGDRELPEWERRRDEVRRHWRAGRRRLSFKQLGDGVKQRMLNPFLRAADLRTGICVCVVVDKALPSMFAPAALPDPSADLLRPFAALAAGIREKMFRVTHFVSLLVAGLSRPGQDVFWFSDQDDIAPNETGIRLLTQAWAGVMSMYLGHKLGHLRCGTTGSDDGSLQIEDLAAIPDLVAGATAETIGRYAAQGLRVGGGLMLPRPAGISRKANEIMAWLGDTRWPLRRLVYTMDAIPGSTAVDTKRVIFHSVPADRLADFRL